MRPEEATQEEDTQILSIPKNVRIQPMDLLGLA